MCAVMNGSRTSPLPRTVLATLGTLRFVTYFARFFSPAMHCKSIFRGPSLPRSMTAPQSPARTPSNCLSHLRSHASLLSRGWGMARHALVETLSHKLPDLPDERLLVNHPVDMQESMHCRDAGSGPSTALLGCAGGGGGGAVLRQCESDNAGERMALPVSSVLRTGSVSIVQRHPPFVARTSEGRSSIRITYYWVPELTFGCEVRRLFSLRTAYEFCRRQVMSGPVTILDPPVPCGVWELGNHFFPVRRGRSQKNEQFPVTGGSQLASPRVVQLRRSWLPLPQHTSEFELSCRLSAAPNDSRHKESTEGASHTTTSRYSEL